MGDIPFLSLMRLSGLILGKAFDAVEPLVVAGVSTGELDSLLESFIRSAGALPVFKGYHGFPAASCTSVNDCAVHGIPSYREVLHDGDIISIDCGVSFRGAITDACRTFFVGPESADNTRLVNTTYSALSKAIENALPGNRIGDISYAIQREVETAGFNVARDFTGHAVGRELHMPPWIPSYGIAHIGPLIEEGMFIAIEPVVFSGSWKYSLRGRWSSFSVDGGNVAHFEDTLYISKEGPEVLTR